MNEKMTTARFILYLFDNGVELLVGPWLWVMMCEFSNGFGEQILGSFI